MKAPRIADFDPTVAERELGSPLDDMPAIKPPVKKMEIPHSLEIQNSRNLEKKNSRIEEIQDSTILESQKSRNVEIQNSRNLEPRTVSGATTPMEKIAFRFHPEGRFAVEDMKTDLLRHYGIKASREQIVEEAVLLVSEDLRQNGNASLLARRLSKK
jgi:hypothetical protein